MAAVISLGVGALVLDGRREFPRIRRCILQILHPSMLAMVRGVDEGPDRRLAIVIEWRHQPGSILEKRLAVIVGVKSTQSRVAHGVMYETPAEGRLPRMSNTTADDTRLIVVSERLLRR